MVAWQNGITTVAIKDAIARSPLFVEPNSYLVQTARALGIYVGDGTYEVYR